MIAASASHRMVDKIMYASRTAYAFDASASPWSSSRRIAAILCAIAEGSLSLPAQGHADVSRHAARKVDDLEPQFVAARLEVRLPEFIELLGQPGQRALPAGFLLIDGAAVIGAKLIGKAEDEYLGQAVIGGALDDRRRALHSFLVGNAGRLCEPFHQSLLFGFLGGLGLQGRGRLCGLAQGNLLHQILG